MAKVAGVSTRTKQIMGRTQPPPGVTKARPAPTPAPIPIPTPKPQPRKVAAISERTKAILARKEAQQKVDLALGRATKVSERTKQIIEVRPEAKGKAQKQITRAKINRGKQILKDVGLGLIPIYGTVREAKALARDWDSLTIGQRTERIGWTSLGVLADATILIPGVGLALKTAKGAATLGKATTKVGASVIRVTPKAATKVARVVKEVAKTAVTPEEGVVLRSSFIPLPLRAPKPATPIRVKVATLEPIKIKIPLKIPELAPAKVSLARRQAQVERILEAAGRAETRGKVEQLLKAAEIAGRKPIPLRVRTKIRIAHTQRVRKGKAAIKKVEKHVLTKRPVPKVVEPKIVKPKVAVAKPKAKPIAIAPTPAVTMPPVAKTKEQIATETAKATMAKAKVRETIAKRREAIAKRERAKQEQAIAKETKKQLAVTEKVTPATKPTTKERTEAIAKAEEKVAEATETRIAEKVAEATEAAEATAVKAVEKVEVKPTEAVKAQEAQETKQVEAVKAAQETQVAQEVKQIQKTQQAQEAKVPTKPSPQFRIAKAAEKPPTKAPTKRMFKVRLPDGEVKLIQTDGRHPRVIQFSAGIATQRIDLDTGHRLYFRTPLEDRKKSPSETFQIIEFDDTPLESRLFKQGAFDIKVRPRDLTFSRRRRM